MERLVAELKGDNRMQYKGKEISQEMIEKAMQCKDAQELVKAAGENGFDMSLEEAEAFLSENADVELDAATLEKVAGGDGCYGECPDWYLVG